MMKSPEDLLKMQSEAFGASNAVMAKAVEQFEKLAALNLKAATDTFAQSTDQLKALLSAKDPQQAAKLLSEMAQPSSEALTTYAKEFFELSSKTGNELTAMAEKQIADGNRQLLTAVELFAKSAPAGSEGAVQMLRTSVTAASSAYDQVFKVTRQLAEQAEAGLTKAGKAAGGKKA